MSHEGTMLRGRIAQTEQKQRMLRVEAKSLIVSMRQDLDPYQPNPANLATERIMTAGVRLHEIATELREVDATLIDMRQDLG